MIQAVTTGWRHLVRIISISAIGISLLPSTFAAGIVPSNSFGWSDTLGWVNFLTPQGNVDVTDTMLSGYIWNDTYGWIDLQPAQSGVQNDGQGNLSGFAWGENIGYIDFSAVTIDANGYFHGYASGDILGSLSLNCANTLSCADQDFVVQTFWRPLNTSSTPGSTNNGGGSGGGFSSENTNAPSTLPGDTTEPLRPAAPEAPEVTTNQAPQIPCTFQSQSPTTIEQELLSCSSSCIEQPLRRGELLTLLFPEGCQESTNTSPFPDVPLDHPATYAISAAKQERIIQGYGDGTFRPDVFASNAESIAILERYFNKQPLETLTLKHDYEADAPWYKEYLQFFSEKTQQEPQPEALPTRKDIARYIRNLVILLQQIRQQL